MRTSLLVGLFVVAVVAVSAVAGVTRSNNLAEQAVEEARTTSAANDIDAPAVELATVTAEEIQAMQRSATPPIIIDARSAEEYASAHITDAVNLRAEDATPEVLASIAPDKETTLVFYCGDAQCLSSAQAAYKAALAGYNKLFQYTAGLSDWQQKRLPVSASAS